MAWGDLKDRVLTTSCCMKDERLTLVKVAKLIVDPYACDCWVESVTLKVTSRLSWPPPKRLPRKGAAPR